MTRAQSAVLIIHRLGRGKGQFVRCEGYDANENKVWTQYGPLKANAARNAMKSRGKPVQTKIVTK